MPPRSQPKIHQIQMRTHQLSIMLTVPPSTTIESLKAEALSALTSPVLGDEHADIPKVETDNDFELCRAVKARGKPTGEYEVLETFREIREYSLAAYDSLYLQFRDSSGNLLPVTVTTPSVGDEEGPPYDVPEVESPASSISKGKRKANFDE
ncbi:hypothetical protein LshimejAT787_0110950 [Lyophyllum shimeji]|uniref:Uncharacterized protein n=1 Tax=Lyophyllum shimeji TaxID=47721 RepID=A0A9P3UKA8_LYOSH|nr:hypothetical protein LshimejAT787_0110950 [Lyophyllum shimeji]